MSDAALARGRLVHSGFTLMETLVMLVLVSFAVLLMFQMLGTYRIARERVTVLGAGVDREALFNDWYADSIAGLHSLDSVPFQGDARAFSGVTLNPLIASPGAPIEIRWALEPTEEGGWAVAYAEAGEVLWTLPLSSQEAPGFASLDASGTVHETWPPQLGMQSGLPRSVAFLRDGGEGTRVHVASVRGPLESQDHPFELERD